MATSGDGTTPYESRGAGGKFRKRPLRRSIPATPYSRPPTAVRNDNPSMLKKLVDPASRLIYAGAQRLFDVFRKSLPPLSLRPPEVCEEPLNVSQKDVPSGNNASTSAATGISELEQMLQQKTFTSSEIQRLTSLLHSKTTKSPSDELPEQHGDKRDNLHAPISSPIVTSRVLEEEIASPAKLAKYYMGSRPTSQAPRQDSKLLPATPITPLAQKTANSLRNIENGYVTPRSRGRSAMYTMARRSYSGSLSTSSQQALKRRCTVLDDDIGSGSSIRRVRQKANLLSQRDRKELGYPAIQQPDGAGPKLLLTNGPAPKVPDYASVPPKSTQTANKILQHLEYPSPKPGPIEKTSVSTLAGMREKSPNKLKLDMLHGQALRSLEKVDSPKLLPSCHDIQKPVVPELTFQSKNKTEENNLRKLPAPHNISASVNGDMTVTDGLKDKAPAAGITNIPLKAIEEPEKKHAFQMSAPEGSFEMDDDEDGVHDNGHALPPLVENNNKPETSAADIIKTPEASVTPKLVENNKPVFEAFKVPEQVKLKKVENDISTPKTDFGSVGGSVSEQRSGFKIPVLSPSSSSLTTAQTSVFKQSTLPVEKNEPVKVSPSLFSANEHSEIKPNKPNSGSDPKENNSISEFNSVAKNDQVKFSVSNKGENGNWNGIGNGNDGKSDSLFPAVSAATSANGVFSFGTPTKNLSTPDTTPASNPPKFPSWTLSPDSTSAVTATTAASTSTAAISTAIAPAAISSTSVLPQVFSFGSGSSTALTSSVAQTANTTTSTSSPFAITTFATTTTTTAGNGLFGFGSSAAATSTTTATGSGLFGFGSSAVAPSTTPATGSSLFGVSSAAAAISTSTATGSSVFAFGSSAATTSTTTASGSGVFGFGSSSAATSTTTTTGSGLFGFSSPAAAMSTTTTGNGPFSFSSPAALTSTTAPATGIVPFGFSSPAASTSTTTTAAGGGLFSFSSPAAATTSTTTSQSHGSFFNITSGNQANTNASSSSTLFGSSTPAFSSSPSFGITSVGPTSETKSGSTTSIFGSTWQQPQKPSAFGSTFSSPSPSTFTFGASPTPTASFTTAGASNSSFGGPSVFTNSTPVFGGAATAPNNNNDQMSMEDSMAEDSMPTQNNVSPFGQAPVSAPGFMFGSATPTPTPPVASFSFGGQPNQAPPPQNPFQSSSVEFNAGGGSFSLGSGGEKSNRRIVRVAKSKNRKK